ncbi:Hypothetical predicted protein [Lecanosticta acicola]|uniref:Uncharacterized protein n=1 Tax=Lecanosticta acicola TaxID=111012 RepID=A0AAI8Z758_9PEZI|nr:Hypothetical predicted protein [Lecanosticta acicola]
MALQHSRPGMTSKCVETEATLRPRKRVAYYEDFLRADNPTRKGNQEGWAGLRGVARDRRPQVRYRRAVARSCCPAPAENLSISLTAVYLDSQTEFAGQYHKHPCLWGINCVVPIDATFELEEEVDRTRVSLDIRGLSADLLSKPTDRAAPYMNLTAELSEGKEDENIAYDTDYDPDEDDHHYSRKDIDDSPVERQVAPHRRFGHQDPVCPQLYHLSGMRAASKRLLLAHGSDYICR